MASERRIFPTGPAVLGTIGVLDLGLNWRAGNDQKVLAHVGAFNKTHDIGWLTGSYVTHPAQDDIQIPITVSIDGQVKTGIGIYHQPGYISHNSFTPEQTTAGLEVIGGAALTALAIGGLYQWLKYPPRKG